MKQEQKKQQQKRVSSEDQSEQKRPRVSNVSMGFTNKLERGGSSRREFQRQQGTGSSVPAEVSRVSALASCEHCGRNHGGVCRRVTGCWKCGAPDHQLRDCIRMRKAKGQALQLSHEPRKGGQMQ